MVRKKICRQCQKEFIDVTYFGKRGTFYCSKKCAKKFWNRKRYLKDKEKILERVKKWQAENKDKVNLYKRKNKEKYRDIYREKNRLWARNHSDKIKAWQEAHPDKVKEYKRKYEINHGYRGYPDEFNGLLKLKIKERDNFICQDCGTNQNLVIHHLDENKENNNPENLITLCWSCHMARHRKPFLFINPKKVGDFSSLW